MTFGKPYESQSTCVGANPTAAFYAARVIDKANRTYTAYEDPWTFIEKYASTMFQPTTHAYEVIKPDVPVKLYVVVDSTDEQDIDDLIAILIKGILETFEVKLKRSEFVAVMSDDNGPSHIISNSSHRFTDMRALKDWITHMGKVLNIVAKNVYAKNQLMMVIGSTELDEIEYLGDPVDVTTDKKGLVTKKYKKFLDSCLITSPTGHTSTYPSLKAFESKEVEPKALESKEVESKAVKSKKIKSKAVKSKKIKSKAVKSLKDLSLSDSDDEDAPEPKRVAVRTFVGQHRLRLDEKFDKNKLNYLIQNREEFTKNLRQSGRASDPNCDPFQKPLEYLLASQDGRFETEYHKAGLEKTGRLFAYGGLSQQGFYREIRHTIASEFYDDLDMVNAHPVILRHFCEKHDIAYTCLQMYITDRETVIADIVKANFDSRYPLTRQRVKSCILSMINGGEKAYKAIESKTKWIKRFHKEIVSIKADLEDEYEDFFAKVKADKEKDPNWAASGRHYGDCALNLMFCDVENNALMHMCEFLHAGGEFTNNAVLCFDGIMIPKIGDRLDDVVAECGKYVSEKMGFQIDLKAKPMDEGFTLPEKIEPYVEICGITASDPFTWLDFDKKYRGQTFNSIEDLINDTRYDLRRVYARVEQGKSYIIKKSDCDKNLHNIIQGDAKFTDLFFNYKTDGKTKEITFSKYIQYAAKKAQRYESIDFAPGSDNRKMFNLFSGYKATVLDEYDISKIKRPLLHIRDIICDGDEEVFTYYMRWLAILLEHPDRRTGVVPFLYSEAQGTGKNSIFQFISKFVVGPTYVREVVGLQPLLEKHNTVLQGRKLIVVNEASSTKDSFMSNFDKFKSIITDSSLWIDPKGKDGFDIQNLLEITISSNHCDSLRVEESDRRYLAISVNESKAGDTRYFKKLYNSFNDEAGNHFMTYVIKEYGGDQPLGPPPMTKLKQDMINISLPSPIRFLKAKPWKPEDGADSDEDSEDESDEPDWSADEVYTLYLKWCEEEHEARPYKKNAFQQKVKSRVTEVIVLRRRKNYYQLNKL
jgi:hypothetical protein